MTQSLEEQVAHLQKMLSAMSYRIQDLENELRAKIHQIADKIKPEDEIAKAIARDSKFVAQAKLERAEQMVEQFQKEYKDWASPNDDIFIGRGGY